MSNRPKPLVFEGAKNFRLRLILSTLSGKPIKITKIRPDDQHVGIRDEEASFLRLLSRVTNGAHIQVGQTGTSVIYYPGIITGGERIHPCATTSSKPVGYYLEPLLYIAPFSKEKFSIKLQGITASKEDAGVEAIRLGLLPIMEKFGIRDPSLHILKRGSPPNGGGEVHFLVDSTALQPLTMHAIDIPKISAIRGVAYCTRVSPSIVNRMIDAARNVLRPIGVEVDITADVWRGENAGKSPGFGLTLVAESKKGWNFFAEDIGGAGEVPEDIGTKVAYELIEEISKAGVVGRSQLSLALVYMVLGKEDIGRLRINKEQIDEDLIYLLRDIKTIFGTEIYLKEVDDDDSGDFIATVKGTNFLNPNKKM
ncbi:putative RNA 3'-terminal phosphate cyclase [Wickerhamomyces ciferrii]|uniref:RNA 3'-terminal phosphate cyclase n=1 Tax=Wickerhamomyces ciferrii (strain ATCC 14091 / BCRC 22168 / CBS 111 / JCM 3599 / NBRC 0793 / NRRL Y-1031 F-60-10) TaxID=1206466 RepID=K0KG45_WICCF|nr:putative RNA 3'-terminal phosphate cyclase [Wickerhamomyces ciferrii]CCH41916.1 putative RNA 3'-terminal phosphate cyclase [Wickerhamomyces ciferrii]